MNAVAHLDPVARKAKLRTEDFILLAESGAFDDYAKTELIDGEIVYMNAQWSPHGRAKSELALELGLKLRELGSPLRAQIETSVRLSDESLPEPDIVLTDYRGEGPIPVETVAMIVEVSDTTFESDIGRKSELYASAGVPEYWVVDLNDRRVICQMSPEDGNYPGHLDAPFGARLHSGSIEGLDVPSDGLD